MIFFQNNNTTMRRSKTLQQQAKYYEVANEFKMMDVMLTSWIVGNSRKFKDYFKALNKENRRKFINYAWCNTEASEFYDIIDFLFF